jgi:hypothetical protein
MFWGSLFEDLNMSVLTNLPPSTTAPNALHNWDLNMPVLVNDPDKKT